MANLKQNEKSIVCDYKFVDPIPSSLICSICTRVKIDAHQVTCCSMIYCKSCLEKNRNQEAGMFECPRCYSDLTEKYTCIRHKETINKINDLRIRCSNRTRGCMWIGHLKDSNGHRQICPNEIVECTNNKRLVQCGQKVQRYELHVHMTQHCEWRIVKCPHCNEEGTFNYMTVKHLDVCPDIELQCGNEGCPLRIKRCLLADHHDVCPKHIIMCRFHFVGCREKRKREDIPEHNQQSVEEHLSKAVTCIQDLEATSHVSDVIKLYIEKENEEVISSGFYAFKGGLKLAVKAKCEKRQSVPFNLHVSVAIMPGRYDDLLDWPARGKVKIKLFNQKEDRSHKTAIKEIAFQDKVVPPKIYGKWMHASNFILNRVTAQSYALDNNYYIKVTLDPSASTKTWLV